MKLINNLMAGILCVLLLNSCVKDTGNYTYKYGNEVTLRHVTYSYSGFLGDTLRVYATRVFSNPDDTTDFDHAWYINGKVYSDKPVLEFVGKEIGTFSGKYYMIDRKTGIYMSVPSGFNITVTSPFQAGWGILYEKGGKSELAHIRVTNGAYFSYTDLYKTNNAGEEMGSQPVKLRDYPVNGGRGMFVIQHGGQGSMELNAYSMKKQLLTSASFVGGKLPANFTPVDAGFFNTSDMIANSNGDIYVRFFQNPIAYTVPWLNVPVQVSKGMKVTDIWDSWSGSMAYTFMYDKLNNRVLYVRQDAPNITGGVNVIDTMPTPTPASVTFPDNYANLNGMGNWEYVWGGTLLDGGYTAAGALLIRNPADQQVYYQSFTSKSVNRLLEWAPKQHVPFTGTAFITAKSKYAPLKSREYLFFSGGANNDKLYYFDAKSGTTTKLYKEFTSPITVITSSDNSNELAIGFEDGTFLVYDVSGAVMINGTAPELYRLTGLGKVVDVIVKGGNTR